MRKAIRFCFIIYFCYCWRFRRRSYFNTY